MAHGSPWFCFVLAIVLGVLYRWASVRRVWDDLHEMQRTTKNADRPGFRVMWWVIHFPNFNLSRLYGGMMVFQPISRSVQRINQMQGTLIKTDVEVYLVEWTDT